MIPVFDFGFYHLIKGLCPLFHVIWLHLELCDSLHCRPGDHCAVNSEYPVGHETSNFMHHAEPPAQLCQSEPCIFVVPTLIVKAEVEVFGDVNGIPSYPLERGPSFEVRCVT